MTEKRVVKGEQGEEVFIPLSKRSGPSFADRVTHGDWTSAAIVVDDPKLGRVVLDHLDEDVAMALIRGIKSDKYVLTIRHHYYDEEERTEVE